MTYANVPQRQGLPASAAGQPRSNGGLAAARALGENLSEEVAAGSTPVGGTTYTVASANCDLLSTSSLRRAWEAQRYFEESSPYGAIILNRNRADLDHDGLTGDEVAELESYDVWSGGKVAPVHLCIQRGVTNG